MGHPEAVSKKIFFKQVASPVACGSSQVRGQATATVEATPSTYVVSHMGSLVSILLTLSSFLQIQM